MHSIMAQARVESDANRGIDVINSCEKDEEWQLASALLSTMAPMLADNDTSNHNAMKSVCEKGGVASRID